MSKTEKINNVIHFNPPANTEAEQSILGAILVRPEVMDRVADLLTPKDFYRQAHSRIYQAILDLYNRHEPVDLVSVTALLKERGHLEGVGGPVFLAGLSEQVGFAANADYYARLVRDKARLRRIIDCSQGIAAACLAGVENMDEFVDWVETQTYSACERDSQAAWIPVGELMVQEGATIEKIHESPLRVGLKTWYPDLDRYVSFQPGDLIILAARPGEGKTALAQNIATKIAQSGKAVAFFSLEMAKEQLARRQLSQEGRIDHYRLERVRLTQDDWVKLYKTQETVENLPLMIDDTPALNVLEIGARSRRLKTKQGLGIIIVDYLQLLKPMKRGRAREEEVAESCRGLKALAKKMKVPVLAVSQLNRKVEERTDKKPKLSDLRESGAIEQDADIVLFIYNPKGNGQEKDIIVAKNRNGRTGVARLTWLPDYLKFESQGKEPL